MSFGITRRSLRRSTGGDDAVDQAVLEGRLRAHVVVALGVGLDLLERWPVAAERISFRFLRVSLISRAAISISVC